MQLCSRLIFWQQFNWLDFYAIHLNWWIRALYQGGYSSSLCSGYMTIHQKSCIDLKVKKLYREPVDIGHVNIEHVTGYWNVSSLIPARDTFLKNNFMERHHPCVQSSLTFSQKHKTCTILSWLMLDNFTHQGESSCWERVMNISIHAFPVLIGLCYSALANTRWFYHIWWRTSQPGI